MNNARKFGIGGLLATLACNLCCGEPATNSRPEDAAVTLQRLQEQLEQQTKRVDRLYRAFGPELGRMEAHAAALEKQQQEDIALALREVARVMDRNLSSLGCVNPAAAEFAVITRDGTLRIFDGHGKAGKEFHQPGRVFTAVAYSPSGKDLLVGTDDGALLVWDVAKGACVIICTNLGRQVDRVTWLGNDRVAWGGSVTYWADGGKPVNHDKPAGAVLARETGKVLWEFRSYIRDDFYTLAGARDGRYLAVLEIPDRARAGFLLDGATGAVLQTCYDREHPSGPLSVGISPDGRILVVGYAPSGVILWEAATGKQQALLEGHQNWVVSLAFSADSKRLVSGSGDSTARIWDTASGKEIGRIRFPGPSTYVESVGLSPKGDLVFASVRGALVVAKGPP